jgi:hypothetical protein
MRSNWACPSGPCGTEATRDHALTDTARVGDNELPPLARG